MPSVTLRGHFNGTQVVLDESFPLEPNVKLLITVVPSEAIDENENWLQLSTDGLEMAYGEDEPEYSIADLKKVNPEYDRR